METHLEHQKLHGILLEWQTHLPNSHLCHRLKASRLTQSWNPFLTIPFYKITWCWLVSVELWWNMYGVKIHILSFISTKPEKKNRSETVCKDLHSFHVSTGEYERKLWRTVIQENLKALDYTLSTDNHSSTLFGHYFISHLQALTLKNPSSLSPEKYNWNSFLPSSSLHTYAVVSLDTVTN